MLIKDTNWDNVFIYYLMFVQSLLFIFISSIIAGSFRVSLIIGCGGAEDLRAWWRVVIFYLNDGLFTRNEIQPYI